MPLTALDLYMCRQDLLCTTPCLNLRSTDNILPLTSSGDLLFITASSQDGVPPPVRVSHVIVWTGHRANFSTSGKQFSWDTLLANTKPSERPAAQAYATARVAAGLPLYVITDSHYTGPNYRPFAGECMIRGAGCVHA